MTNTKKYEVHGVLAGAYAGKNPKLESTLTHASLPETWEDAICGRVKPGSLCDQIEAELTCPRCIAKVAKLGLTPAE
jgi:hypothetical protein